MRMGHGPLCKAPSQKASNYTALDLECPLAISLGFSTKQQLYFQRGILKNMGHFTEVKVEQKTELTFEY